MKPPAGTRRSCFVKLVADANVLFSCLLRDGLTRRLWFDSEFTLYSPAYIIVEFLKHREYLYEKYVGEKGEMDLLFEKALAQMTMVGDKSLDPYLPAAAILSTDGKDWLYLACALKEDAAVWSNDRHFASQRRVIVKTTKQLAEELLKE